MIRLLIACFATLLVCSCLESHEEVWLNADASGKARIKISLPLHTVSNHGGEKGVRTMITDYFESTPAFTGHTVATSVTDEQLEIDVSMTFDNANDLQSATSGPAYDKLPSIARDLIGQTKVKFEDAKLNFHRHIDLTKSIPGSMFIPSEEIKEHKLTTIIHLPKASSSHNAHTIADSGKSLTWSTPLASAFREPMHQSFIMPLPLPWFRIIAIAVICAALIYYAYRRNKKKRMAIM